MSIQKKLKDIKDKKSYSTPAKRILEHLKPILSKSDELQKRWMWELLQNASDLGDTIQTEFEVTDSQLIFRHNGKPFGLDEAYNLIMPDSSKDEEILHTKDQENPPIGQFGTGFISTHILSKKIKIKGIVKDEEENKFFSFSFSLDRSERTNKDFLINSIKNSEIEYGNSLTLLTNFKPSEFDTEFFFDLTETYSKIDKDNIIDEGLTILDDLIPFVLAFRPQIKSVRVKDFRNNKSIIKIYEAEILNSNIERIDFVRTNCKLAGKEIESKLIATVKEKNTTVAINVKKINEEVYEIQPFPSYSPILYCAFPMIGATEFNFPTIIHSKFFTPNINRDGIEISQFDEENRNRLIEAKDAFLILIDVVEKYKWEKSYYLFNISKVDLPNTEIHNWYEKFIFIPIKDKLRTANVIRESDELDSDYSSISDIYLPYVDKRKSNRLELLAEIYSFSDKLLHFFLPSLSTYDKWYSKIDYELFDASKLDVEEICKVISTNYVGIEDISKKKKTTDELIVKYLIDFTQFIITNEYFNLLTNYKIIPNQNGHFCLVKKLKVDFISHKSINPVLEPEQSYEDKIKSIGNELTDIDCKDFLLHTDFESIENLVDLDSKYHLSELCKSIDDKLRNFDGSFNNASFLLILKKLFNWYANCGISDDTLNEYFHYFSLNKSQLYLNTKTPQELEYAFDIEISGKSEVLAKIAKSGIEEKDLWLIAENSNLISSFVNWLSEKKEDNPNEELGDIGEEFLYFHLCQIFDKDNVLWEKKREYDFKVLVPNSDNVRYYIDAKTTAQGISNTENVPFYMRMAQWDFLKEQQAFDKYIIARVYKNENQFNVKYVKINLLDIK